MKEDSLKLAKLKTKLKKIQINIILKIRKLKNKILELFSKDSEEFENELELKIEDKNLLRDIEQDVSKLSQKIRSEQQDQIDWDEIKGFGPSKGRKFIKHEILSPHDYWYAQFHSIIQYLLNQNGLKKIADEISNSFTFGEPLLSRILTKIEESKFNKDPIILYSLSKNYY